MVVEVTTGVVIGKMPEQNAEANTELRLVLMHRAPLFPGSPRVQVLCWPLTKRRASVSKAREGSHVEETMATDTSVSCSERMTGWNEEELADRQAAVVLN